MAKIKRSTVKTFLNTGTPISPVWVLVGAGVTTASIAYNPKVTSETYIVDDNATGNVEDYAPTFPVEMVANNTEAVFEYLDNLRKLRSVLESAETEITNVWLYETPAGGYYHAEKQAVSIQINDFGGEGGSAAKIGYTLNFRGNPGLGIFKPAATATFEALPVTTILTTMGLTNVTLTPLFVADKSNLLYTSSCANAVVNTAMTSTLSGATILQQCNGVDVLQAGLAALNVGLNLLTIRVTVAAVISTYRIDITRAAV